jgi:2,3-bisphosphoglycerate-independent phosphoglycerate mutase
VDRRAGRDLTQEEAGQLAEELNGIRLADARFEFRATLSYRGVLVIHDAEPLFASVSNTDPAYDRVGGFGAARETQPGERILRSTAEGNLPAARRAAALVNEFTGKALQVLKGSEVNRRRAAAGRLPANAVLLRDAGDHVPQLTPFSRKYGVEGAALVEMPAEVGIAKLLGMKMVKIKDRNDLGEKATLFKKELKPSRVVYVHIKGPDVFGHDGDATGKKRCVESIDSEFFSTVTEVATGVRLGVSCDHATPCWLKMHSSDPVPLLITSEGKGDGMRFTERNARRGSLGMLRGRDVLRNVLQRASVPIARV